MTIRNGECTLVRVEVGVGPMMLLLLLVATITPWTTPAHPATTTKEYVEEIRWVKVTVPETTTLRGIQEVMSGIISSPLLGIRQNLIRLAQILELFLLLPLDAIRSSGVSI